MFYTYTQNNSGGHFDFTPSAGISHHVIVEAENEREADERAEAIGLYWNGCDEGFDCDCCGDRWYSQQYYGDDGSDEPTIHSQPVADAKLHKWINGPEVYVHYLDGRVVGFHDKQEDSDED